MRRPLSKSQIVCVSLLWLALCYLVLTKAERIDGMTIVMLVISAALVFIPVYKSTNLMYYCIFLYKMFASSIFIFTFATA